jgi:hypothetical protein
MKCKVKKSAGAIKDFNCLFFRHKIWRVKFLKIIIILFPLFCFGQQREYKPMLNASIGCNISRHYVSTTPLDRGADLNLGLNGLIPVRDALCLKTSISLSWMRSTWACPFFKLRNEYLEFSFCAAARLGDELIFSAGINHAELLNSKLLRLDPSARWKAYDINLYSSQQSIDLGLELKLQKNFSLLFDYFIPLKQFDTKNFRVGINLRLSGRTKGNPNPRKAIRQKAIAQINDLKNGTLLVRLHTSSNKIAAMKEAGKEKQAAKTLRKQQAENREIVTAFRSYFTFCPVMFFFSDNSEKVLQKNFSGIFLNDSMQIDSTLKPDETKNFFVAEFTYIEQDTGMYFSHYNHVKDSTGNYSEVKNYYGGPNVGFYALVIRDENFNQLDRPFPYYVQLFGKSLLKEPETFLIFPPWYFFIANYSYSTAVKIINDKMRKFHDKNH